MTAGRAKTLKGREWLDTPTLDLPFSLQLSPLFVSVAQCFPTFLLGRISYNKFLHPEERHSYENVERPENKEAVGRARSLLRYFQLQNESSRHNSRDTWTLSALLQNAYIYFNISRGTPNDVPAAT